MRRAIVVSTGLLLAFLSGMILLAAGLVIEALSVPAAESVAIVRTLALMLASLGPETAPRWFIAGLHAAWVAALALCAAPVTLVALLGEAAGLRALPWYAGATGVVTAAMPQVARAAFSRSAPLSGSALEGQLTLLFFLAGIGTGGVYWAVAGRSSGDPHA